VLEDLSEAAAERGIRGVLHVGGDAPGGVDVHRDGEALDAADVLVGAHLDGMEHDARAPDGWRRSGRAGRLAALGRWIDGVVGWLLGSGDGAGSGAAEGVSRVRRFGFWTFACFGILMMARGIWLRESDRGQDQSPGEHEHEDWAITIAVRPEMKR
jgi:hypothetical protein